MLLVVLVLLCNHSELSVTTYDPEGDGMHGLTEFMILLLLSNHIELHRAGRESTRSESNVVENRIDPPSD